ncbi:MAG: hypothetical protein H0W07_00525 [Chloroflexi bacterium]|nr:hypothetical protein [Chloroflexota bacterium]
MTVPSPSPAPDTPSPRSRSTSPTAASPSAEVTFALPTATNENLPSEPPAETIPPGFTFPVPSPLTEGNAEIYAQRALFERTRSLCFTHCDVEKVEGADYEAMAAALPGREGLLEDGRSYVGPLDDALAALDLEPTGIALEGVAYGIGIVGAQRALPQLPVGVVWAPRLAAFSLADGRGGWTLDGPWIAVAGDCGMLPRPSG